jgi:uncharacterized protein
MPIHAEPTGLDAPSDLNAAIRRAIAPAERARTDQVPPTACRRCLSISPASSNGSSAAQLARLSGLLPKAKSMDAATILHELSHTAGLPRTALRAASAERTELLPKFLGAIEDHLGREQNLRTEPTPLFFIFHLLGEWREKTAYRPLASLLRCSCDEIDAIFGDATTSTCHRVMAAVFDGDPQPLFDIILDPNADEFIRSRMCEALAMIALRGELDRDRAARFLRDAFNDLRPQRECYVWVGWQSAIAMLGLGELKVFVKRAFDRGFIDRHILGFKHFEDDLRRGIKRPGEPWAPDDDEYELFGDTVEELSGWACFTEHDDEDQEEWRQLAALDRILGEPHHNPLKGIGRNDPCPCGSGKKFKKCCLQ